MQPFPFADRCTSMLALHMLLQRGHGSAALDDEPLLCDLIGCLEAASMAASVALMAGALAV